MISMTTTAENPMTDRKTNYSIFVEVKTTGLQNSYRTDPSSDIDEASKMI